LVNTSSHCAASKGGTVPTSGCHSTIDRPEWVSRVTPPTTISANNNTQQASSQTAIDRRGALSAAFAWSTAMGIDIPCSMITPFRLRPREHAG
jgi:hypothetical protein